MGEIQSSSAVHSDLVSRFESRFEALQLEVAAAAALRSEVESRYGRVKVELEGRLESRIANLRGELEDRLEAQLRNRVDMLHLEWRQDLKGQEESQVRLGEDLVCL